MSKAKITKKLSTEAIEELKQVIKSLKGFSGRKKSPVKYNKNIVQDDLADIPGTTGKGEGFILKGEPTTKDFTMPAEGALPPALRGSMDAVPMSKPASAGLPELVPGSKPGLPSLTGKPDIEAIATKVDDIADPILSLPAPAMKQGMSRFQKLATGAGLAGAGGAAMFGLSEDEQQTQPEVQIPFRRPEPQVQPEEQSMLDQMDAGAQDEALNQIGAEEAASPEKQEAARQAQQEADYLKLLREAQQGEIDQSFINNMLRAGIQAGSALSMTNPDYSGVEALDKQTGRSVANVKGQMDADMAQQRLRAAKTELQDEASLRDPKSEISKQLRGLLSKAGYPVAENVSAKNLKDMGINPYNILTSIESARIAAEGRGEAREDRSEAKARSEITSMVTNFSKSKDLERYNNAKEAMDGLNLAIESGDKTAIGSAFMKFAKEAQGDTSVVRDGDMRVLAGGYNFLSPSQMITKLAAKAQGGDFNKQELQQMKKVVEMGIGARRKRLQQQASPIFSRIQKSGMDESIFFDPTLASEFRGATGEQPAQSQSDMVQVQRISDGTIKVVPRSSTTNIDKKKYTILD